MPLTILACLAFVKTFKQSSGYAFKQRTRQRLWQDRPHDHIRARIAEDRYP